MSRSRTPRDADEKCRQCDESRPEAMTKRGLCYECMLIQDRRKPLEAHHPFGRDNRARIVVTRFQATGTARSMLAAPSVPRS